MNLLKSLILAFSLPVLLMAQDTLVFKKNPNYDLQIGFYDIYKVEQADIVMLGNSITHGVNWNELLNRKSISEQGITSDILEGYLNRLNYVIKLKPKVCFVMGGINDIYSGYSAEQVFDNYKKVITTLKNNNIIPVIQSTLYVSPKWHSSEIKNPEVMKLNILLRGLATEQKLDFIDLNRKLAVNRTLLNDYTIDGVHLNAKAYKIWGIEVEKILNKYHL